MKYLKRALALVAALALALTLALPATAAVDFQVINQEEAERYYGGQYFRYGKNVTLRVAVSAPEGLEFTYQWYRKMDYYGNDVQLIEGAVTDTLTLSPGDAAYPAAAKWGGLPWAKYYCDVVGFDPEDGQSERKRSGDFEVYVQNSFLESLYLLTLEPLVSYFEYLAPFDLIDLFAFLVLAPLVMNQYKNNFGWVFTFRTRT